MLTADGFVNDHEVVIQGGRIFDIRPATAPEWELLAPGFIDLQVNGHRDVDVATATDEDWPRLLADLARQGVTSWCPTLISAPLGALDDRLSAIGARLAAAGPSVIGVHLEGPYLGDAHGAHREVAAGPIDLGWLAALPPHVALVTVGPERAGVADAIATLRRRGIAVALGHTTADAATTEAAVDAGATLFTHVFNASGALHHRDPGAIGVALTDDRLRTGLIADGIHVDARVMQLVWRAKGPAGVVLVTDAAAWRADRTLDGAPRLADGTLAGSALRMDAAIRRTVDEVGIDLADALRAAATNPAAALGLDDRGSLTPGHRADLVALSGDLRVEETWVLGEPQLAGSSGS